MAITLSERVTAFLDELSISKTAFCRNVKLSVSSLWRWQHGELELSDATLARIDSYLKKYHF